MKGRNRRPFSAIVELSTENGNSDVYTARSRRHLQTIQYECQYCPQKFNHKDNLVFHEYAHELNRHEPRKAPVLIPKAEYDCNICRKSYKTKCDLDVHIEMHNEKPFRCEECGMSFGEKIEVDRHRNTHLGEKNCKCTQCPKKYASEYQLQCHERIHKWIESVDKCLPFDTDDTVLIFRSEKCENDFFDIVDDELNACHTDELSCSHCNETFLKKYQKLVHECRFHMPQIILRAIDTVDSTNIPLDHPSTNQPDAMANGGRIQKLPVKRKQPPIKKNNKSQRRPVQGQLREPPQNDESTTTKETDANKISSMGNVSPTRPVRAAAIRFNNNISAITRGLPLHYNRDANRPTPPRKESQAQQVTQAQQAIHVKEELSNCHYCNTSFQNSEQKLAHECLAQVPQIVLSGVQGETRARQEPVANKASSTGTTMNKGRPKKSTTQRRTVSGIRAMMPASRLAMRNVSTATNSSRPPTESRRSVNSPTMPILNRIKTEPDVIGECSAERINTPNIGTESMNSRPNVTASNQNSTRNYRSLPDGPTPLMNSFSLLAREVQMQFAPTFRSSPNHLRGAMTQMARATPPPTINWDRAFNQIERGMERGHNHTPSQPPPQRELRIEMRMPPRLESQDPVQVPRMVQFPVNDESNSTIDRKPTNLVHENGRENGPEKERENQQDDDRQMDDLVNETVNDTLNEIANDMGNGMVNSTANDTANATVNSTQNDTTNDTEDDAESECQSYIVDLDYSLNNTDSNYEFLDEVGSMNAMPLDELNGVVHDAAVNDEPANNEASNDEMAHNEVTIDETNNDTASNDPPSVIPPTMETDSQQINKNNSSSSKESAPKFQCNKCARNFNSKRGLMNHRVTHVGELPFKCKYCDGSFRHRSHRSQHEKLSHPAQKKQRSTTVNASQDKSTKSSAKYKEYQCDICNKKLPLKIGLKRHKKVHNLDRALARNVDRHHVF